MHSTATLDRFWAKVDRGEPDECWLWMAARIPRGYGRFAVQKGRIVYAHRFAYEVEVGAIPQGLFVLHSCDNPPCYNPAHLRAGTHGDNMSDMLSRGRANNKMKASAGEKNGRAILTKPMVDQIRARYKRGVVTHAALADEFGVSESTICKLVRGDTWRAEATARS